MTQFKAPKRTRQAAAPAMRLVGPRAKRAAAPDLTASPAVVAVDPPRQASAAAFEVPEAVQQFVRACLKEVLAEEVKSAVVHTLTHETDSILRSARRSFSKALALREAALTASQQAGDPAFLSAAEFARRLRVSDQTVRNLERDGKIFSVLTAGRERGRQYPTFQLYEGVRGRPLETLLAVLHELPGAARYQFCTTPQDVLGGHAPVVVLLGTPAAARDVDRPEPDAVLDRSDDERLALVLEAARTYRDVLAA
jgi:DNA-binding transcriptional regulator YiaG